MWEISFFYIAAQDLRNFLQLLRVDMLHKIEAPQGLVLGTQ